MAQALPHYYFK